MTIYSYFRSSELEATLPDAELETTLEPEFLSIQTYCLARRWFMTEVVRDRNCKWSQEFHKREQGGRLFSGLQSGDVIVASKLERIVSSSAETVRLVSRLRKLGVQLHVVELDADITAADCQVNFLQLGALFSALEKRKAAERIKGVKQRQRKKGRYLGGSRPFGYMIHENGRLIENPMEQRVLRKIMDLKKQGKSLRAISTEVSTPVMPISFKTVQRLLQRHAGQA